MKLLFKQILSIVFFAVLVTSCRKHLLDINVDPNRATTASATPELVLPAALNNTVGIYNNPSADARFAFAGIWMGQIAYSGNYAISTENLSYAITNNFGAGLFGNVYDNLEDYDFIEKKGAEVGNNFYRGIGILMKAYNFQTLADVYNNVPYSGALQGTANSKPAYDDAKTIYDDLGKKIDTAIALFGTSAAGSIGGDIMFGGDPAKWLKFAKTVKLRLLLRQSQRADRAAYITTEVAKLAGASFLDIDATINPGYLNSAGKTNPFWGANINTSGTYTNDFYRAGQYAVKFYLDHNDLRVGKYFKPAASTGIYHGNYFGDQGDPNSKTSEYGPGLLKAFSQPAILMLAAESYFIQAEAALKGWIAGDPKTLYQTGVQKSFTFLGLTVAQAQTYYSQAGDKQVNWDATTSNAEKLALIIRQKWAAETAINELEVYNDYRRLTLPADVPLSLSPYSTGIMPKRLLYPQREYEVNAENVLAQGTITPSSKVWWMP